MRGGRRRHRPRSVTTTSTTRSRRTCSTPRSARRVPSRGPPRRRLRAGARDAARPARGVASPSHAVAHRISHRSFFMALIEVKVPQLSESVAEATLLQWHKKVGEPVARDENLIDVETDKVVLELPAPESGVLTQ